MIKATLYNFSLHRWEEKTFPSKKELNEFLNDDWNWKHYILKEYEEVKNESK